MCAVPISGIFCKFIDTIEMYVVLALSSQQSVYISPPASASLIHIHSQHRGIDHPMTRLNITRSGAMPCLPR